MSVYIRPATLEDNSSICALRKICWLKHYTRPEQNLFPNDILKLGGFDSEEAEKTLAVSLSCETPHHKHFILSAPRKNKDDLLLAWASCDSNTNYLIGLYVHPDQQGNGFGSKLLNWMLDETLDKNRPIFTYAVSFNLRAIAFYQKHGFTMTKPAQQGWEKQNPLKKLPLVELARS